MRRNLIRASVVLGSTTGGMIAGWIISAAAFAKTGAYYHG
jgi:hypothetical protein